MTENAQAQMPQYQCHKKVWALKIKEVRQSPADEVFEGGSWQIIPDGSCFGPVTVPHEFVLKHGPKAGGYYVVYEDGYKSYSPASAFESGYTLISEA